MGAGSGIVIDSDPADRIPRVPAQSRVSHRPRAPACPEPRMIGQPDKFFLDRNHALERRLSVPRIASRPARPTRRTISVLRAIARRSAPRSSSTPQQFADPCRRKVRLLLIDADGNCGISSERSREASDPNRIGRVRISSDAHRSRRRHALPQDHAAPALCAGVFDGPRATASTTCSSSICAAKSLKAPSAMSSSRRTAAGSRRPIECGLLAGVYRRHLLETRPEIEERVLVPSTICATPTPSISPTPCAACAA